MRVTTIKYNVISFIICYSHVFVVVTTEQNLIPHRRPGMHKGPRRPGMHKGPRRPCIHVGIDDLRSS